jgi:hypothetical protein
MTHCDNGHDEILYWTEPCPVCAEKKRHAEKVALLDEKISMLLGTVEDAEARIENYRKELGL